MTVRQIAQWSDLGSSVTVRGEVQHPASYGIEPGERLSSLLKRCGGFTQQAYPYGAVLVRREVRDLEMTSHLELVNRVKREEGYLNALPDGDADQRNAKLTAVSQTETTLQQLEATPPIGRVVIHIPADLKNDLKNMDKLAGTNADVPLRDGDELIIPKKPNYVLVNGQVFNPTAVSYMPGRSAKWYLSQSGGLTQIADKGAVFVIRADGSVFSAKNNSGFLVRGSHERGVEAGGHDCRTGESAQDRQPQLVRAHADGAGGVFGGSRRCLYTPVDQWEHQVESDNATSDRNPKRCHATVRRAGREVPGSNPGCNQRRHAG